jgi:membrane protein YdbS with pleckstrin-like domain
MRRSTILQPSQLFTLAAAAIVTVCVTILHSRLFALNPELGAWGMTFDLAITIPLVYYFAVVRTGAAKPITIAPVFVIGVALAARLIPHGEQAFVRELRWVAAPLELVTLALVGGRLVAMRRASMASDDPLARITAACREVFGASALATFVAFEVTTMYYGLFAWWKKPPSDGYSVHERNGWGVIVAALLLVIAGEGVGMHFLLARSFPRGAWLWTALDLYGALWLFGDYQALRLRRITLDDDALQIRFGLRASATIPYSAIAAIEPQSGPFEKRKETLKVAIVDDPRTIIRLREPMTIQFIAGIRKRIDTIAILADDDGFEADLRSRVA